MQQRFDYQGAAPEGIRAMLQVENYVRRSGLESSLLELIKVRVSQMNGCAYCIDMHTKEARVQGETEQRLYALCAWREAPFYSVRERAALTWAETLTNIQEEHVSDATYEAVRPHFTETELVNLTLAVTTINTWNRIALAFRAVPGS